MTEKEQWNTFYETVGGKYICEECGNILTQSQYNAINQTSAGNWLVIILLSILLTPIFLIIHLIFFGVKKKCPVCRAQKEHIFPLNSPEGMNLFKKKHPEHAHLLDHLPTIEE